MQLRFLESFEKRKEADLLVIPVWKEGGPAYPIGSLKKELSKPLEDFTAQEGEVLFVYPSNIVEKRAVLLGLGSKKELTAERLRCAYGALVRAALKKKAFTLNILVPDQENILGLVEGIYFASYQFSELKSKPEEGLLTRVSLLGVPKKLWNEIESLQTIFEGVNLARNLVNRNADEVTSQYLVKVSKTLSPRIKTLVLDKRQLIREKMGLLLAVSRASQHEPALIVLEYRGKPASKDKTVLIGKGITYDTGGLNLKSVNMENMKADMAGAAACLGVMQTAARLKLKVNVSCVIATCENAIGSGSFKPGDVYTSHSGKTVEIGNTDAEGRLILADALSYALKHLSPTRLIDIATLTGGMLQILGNEGMGLFSNDDKLANGIEKAGLETYERAFRLPLIEELEPLLKSHVADLRNAGWKMAGSMMAALFLKEFAGNIPWAHLDIASVAFMQEPRRYYPRYATGVGVRLLTQMLRGL